jgi:hypothetical protein
LRISASADAVRVVAQKCTCVERRAHLAERPALDHLDVRLGDVAPRQLVEKLHRRHGRSELVTPGLDVGIALQARASSSNWYRRPGSLLFQLFCAAVRNEAPCATSNFDRKPAMTTASSRTSKAYRARLRRSTATQRERQREERSNG